MTDRNDRSKVTSRHERENMEKGTNEELESRMMF